MHLSVIETEFAFNTALGVGADIAPSTCCSSGKRETTLKLREKDGACRAREIR
jgi:hypothetical protein